MFNLNNLFVVTKNLVSLTNLSSAQFEDDVNVSVNVGNTGILLYEDEFYIASGIYKCHKLYRLDGKWYFSTNKNIFPKDDAFYIDRGTITLAFWLENSKSDLNTDEKTITKHLQNILDICSKSSQHKDYWEENK